MNAAARATLARVVNTSDVPVDPDWQDGAALLGDLATLNALIMRYITATLDADAKRGKPVNPGQEAALAQELVDLGRRLQARGYAPSREPKQSGSG